jgi:hypothetical protein
MIRAIYDCNVILSGIGWNGSARRLRGVARLRPGIEKFWRVRVTAGRRRRPVHQLPNRNCTPRCEIITAI